MKKIFVTGGVGYIGSHTVIELIGAGYEVVVYDNLSNSSPIALDRVCQITGKSPQFIEGDVRDKQRLNEVFVQTKFDGVVHLAGLKAVGQSVKQPIRYYNNNVFGSMQLLDVMSNHGVKRIVFSSSASVYGKPSELPLHEKMPTGLPASPYGMSKLMVENILSDVYASDDTWCIARLRYFNPIGAHPSGLIGENPSDTSENLMPLIAQTALRKSEFVPVFGGDYPTPDGSGVRDYIHVVDLAKGHLASLEKCFRSSGMFTVNLGTGEGYSVLQMIKLFEKVNNVSVPYKIVERRAGDVAACYANTQFAEDYLGWRAMSGLEEMCRDFWRWQLLNPEGYVN
jgi:UDP-glucose 4-epimerase